MSQQFVVATLLFNHTGRIADELADRVDAVVSKTALDIEADAKQNITDVGAIETGSMKASVYAATPLGSSYAANTGEARGLNPDAVILSPEPHGEHEAVVAVGVEHGIYNEMGTVRMPPRPFLGPAAEANRRPFERALREVFEP